MKTTSLGYRLTLACGLSQNGCVINPYLLATAPRYNIDGKPVRCDVAMQTVNFSLTRDPLAP